MADQSTIDIADATATATRTAPPAADVGRWMRRLHDGTGMGPLWQTIIFLGGVLPAILALTGIVMWLRGRRWKATLAAGRRAARVA